MIRNTPELANHLQLFNDTAELIELLKAEAAQDDATGSQQYLLREAADHIDALYKLAREMSRALSQYQPAPTTGEAP